jgi:hypothetical protein
MISEEIKTDIFSGLIGLVEDKNNNKKIKNIIDSLSNPVIVRVKYMFFMLLLINFFIIILLLCNLYISYN